MALQIKTIKNVTGILNDIDIAIGNIIINDQLIECITSAIM